MSNCESLNSAHAGATPAFGLFDWYARWAKRRADRRSFRRLLAMDEHTLKDIGVSRGDVVWAANLPIEMDAAKELRRVAGRKR